MPSPDGLFFGTEEPEALPEDDPSDFFYFSVISQTSIGYGDIAPLGWAKVIAAVQGVVGLFFVALGARETLAIITFSIAGFVLTIIVREFVKGTRARARIEGEGVPLAFVHLVGRNRRRWGGYLVHVGIVMIFAAFAASAFNREVRDTLSPGESISIDSPFGHTYELLYEGLSTHRGANAWQWVALLKVSRDGKDIGLITSEKKTYVVMQASVTEVGIRSTPFEDLYVILAAVDDMEGVLRNDPSAETATFQVMVNPLVGWIWYGGLVMTIGTLIALWPARGTARPVRVQQSGTPVREAQPA